MTPFTEIISDCNLNSFLASCRLNKGPRVPSGLYFQVLNKVAPYEGFVRNSDAGNHPLITFGTCTISASWGAGDYPAGSASGSAYFDISTGTVLVGGVMPVPWALLVTDTGSGPVLELTDPNFLSYNFNFTRVSDLIWNLDNATSRVHPNYGSITLTLSSPFGNYESLTGFTLAGGPGPYAGGLESLALTTTPPPGGQWIQNWFPTLFGAGIPFIGARGVPFGSYSPSQSSPAPNDVVQSIMGVVALRYSQDLGWKQYTYDPNTGLFTLKSTKNYTPVPGYYLFDPTGTIPTPRGWNKVDLSGMEGGVTAYVLLPYL